MYSWKQKFDSEKNVGRNLSKSLSQELGPGVQPVKIVNVSPAVKGDYVSLTLADETGGSLIYKLRSFEVPYLLSALVNSDEIEWINSQIKTMEDLTNIKGCALKAHVGEGQGVSISHNSQGYFIFGHDEYGFFKTFKDARDCATNKGYTLSKLTVLNWEKDLTYDKHNRSILFGE